MEWNGMKWDGWMDRGMKKRMNGGRDGWMNAPMQEWMGEWMNGWMDERMGGMVLHCCFQRFRDTRPLVTSRKRKHKLFACAQL